MKTINKYIDFEDMFWDVTLEDTKVTTIFGKTDVNSETLLKKFDTNKEAKAYYEEMLSNIDMTIEFVKSQKIEDEEVISNYQPQYSNEFPFFGAGDASYFEAFNLSIYFKNIPTIKEQKKILKLLPNHFDSDNDSFKGHFLNLYTEYGYDAMDEIYNSNFDYENSETENALLKIDKIVPILFAYREEDTEAEGTHFSPWHKESDPTLVAEKLENNLDTLSYEEVQEIKETLKDIYTLYGLKAKDKNRFRRKIWNPVRPPIDNETVIKKFQEGKIYLHDIYDDNYLEDTFYQLFVNSKKKSLKELFSNHLNYITEVIHYAKKIKDTKTIAYFSDDIIVETFNEYCTSSDFNESKFIKFVSVYFPLLPEKSEKIETYKIYIILNTFHKLDIPIDKTRNTLIAEKALNYALKSPEILHSAACMYSQMNEMEKVYECISKIIEYKLDKIRSYALLNDIKKGKSFENLRKDEKFTTFLSELQKKVDHRFFKPKNVHQDAIVNNYDDEWMYETPTIKTYWYKTGELYEEETFLAPRTYDNVYHQWSYETYDYVQYHKDGTICSKGRSKGGYEDFCRYPIGEGYYCIGKKQYLKNEKKGEKFNWYSQTTVSDEKGRDIESKTKYFDIDGNEMFEV